MGVSIGRLAEAGVAVEIVMAVAASGSACGAGHGGDCALLPGLREAPFLPPGLEAGGEPDWTCWLCFFVFAKILCSRYTAHSRLALMYSVPVQA